MFYVSLVDPKERDDEDDKLTHSPTSYIITPPNNCKFNNLAVEITERFMWMGCLSSTRDWAVNPSLWFMPFLLFSLLFFSENIHVGKYRNPLRSRATWACAFIARSLSLSASSCRRKIQFAVAFNKEKLISFRDETLLQSLITIFKYMLSPHPFLRAQNTKIWKLLNEILTMRGNLISHRWVGEFYL